MPAKMEKLIGNLAALKISWSYFSAAAPQRQKSKSTRISVAHAAYFTGNLPARLFFN